MDSVNGCACLDDGGGLAHILGGRHHGASRLHYLRCRCCPQITLGHTRAGGWRHIVLLELLLELLLLLPLPGDLPFFLYLHVLINTLLLLLLIKVDGGAFPRKLVGHAKRGGSLVEQVVFDYDLGHVLSECGRLLVGVLRLAVPA
jgi:hypothetical protein